MKLFKIRCSAIGQIMGNLESVTEKQLITLNELQDKETRTEKQDTALNDLIKKRDTPTELSETGKTYCENWLKQQLYNRRREFTNKYTEKGIIMEDAAIDFIADYLGYGFLIKNDKREYNDYMSGECDVILPDVIIDAKNSFDPFTFPLFETETDKGYWWQGQGYMELYSRNAYKLIYTLMDTPDNIIEREAFYWCKNNGYDELDDEILQRFYKKMTYGDIEPKLKIKVFDFERDQAAINKIEPQVIKCRKYIQTLIK